MLCSLFLPQHNVTEERLLQDGILRESGTDLLPFNTQIELFASRAVEFAREGP